MVKYIIVIILILSCSTISRKEIAYQNVKFKTNYCPDFGIISPQFLEDKTFLDSNNKLMTPIKDNNTGVIELYESKFITDALNIELEEDYNKFKRIYNDLCSNNPSFESKIPYYKNRSKNNSPKIINGINENAVIIANENNSSDSKLLDMLAARFNQKDNPGLENISHGMDVFYEDEFAYNKNTEKRKKDKAMLKYILFSENVKDNIREYDFKKKTLEIKSEILDIIIHGKVYKIEFDRYMENGFLVNVKIDPQTAELIKNRTIIIDELITLFEIKGDYIKTEISNECVFIKQDCVRRVPKTRKYKFLELKPIRNILYAGGKEYKSF